MRRSFGLLLSMGAVVGLAACPADPSDLCVENCPGLDASPDGKDVGVDAPPGCDPAKDPKDSPACVADSFGLFVDGTNGVDTNPGTQAAPVKTIGKALEKQGPKPRIYVCGGDYGENVLIKAGVSLYGALKCAGWTYDAAAVVRVNPSSGIAVKVEAVTSGVRMADLTLIAPSTSQAGTSSIAGYVANSPSVAFARVNAIAGDAGNGATGNDQGGQPTQTTVGGNGSGQAGGQGPSCICNGQTTNGGLGGGGNGTNPQPGTNGDPNLSGTVPFDGAGGTAGASCTAGHAGANGPAPSVAPGAATLGTLTSTSWTPSAGTNGAVGGLAQGGGGGGGLKAGANGGAGGGGCGGCGGAFGTAGGGGGASAAIVVVSSGVTFEGCTLKSGKAGDGGKGGAGQKGGLGGGAGSPANLGIGGCAGGSGGQGSGGGGGGGGAGGVSAGILFKGGTVTWSGTPVTAMMDTLPSVTAGAPGQKGAGGAGGAVADALAPNPGAAGNNGGEGVAGVSKAAVAAP